MNRRHFLQAGLAGATAVAASRLPAVPLDTPKRPPRHLIVLWMGGGAPHMDLWDIKEGSANQGEFKSIETAVPGIRIGELLPRTAKEFTNLSIIRTLSSRDGELERANYHMTHVFPPSIRGGQCPGVGSVVAHMLGSAKAPVPRCVALGGDPGFGDPGFLAAEMAGFPVANPGQVPDNLTAPDLGDAVTAKARGDLRRDMLNLLDGAFAQAQEEPPPAAVRPNHRNAARRLRELHEIAWNYTGKVGPELFQVPAEESARVHQQFGNTRFGTGCFLATRLVKAGAAAISVTLPGWAASATSGETLRTLAGVLDNGFSGLMAELRATGLLAETVVLCAGPFGRSPRIDARHGRTPWNHGWSVVLGGCGIGGVEYGQMDKDGIAIVKDRASVEQLYATVYATLGIDLNDRALDLHDELGRRYLLTGDRENARPIQLN